MYNHISNRSFRIFYGYLFACLAILLVAGSATAQQIVTNPQLDQTLISFQQNFSQFIQQHPELTSGSTQLIQIDGSKGKVTFTFKQRGQYVLAYGDLQFTPTNPISADRFNTTLTIQNIALVGDANLAITAKSKNYNLQCPNNQFAVGPVTFISEVEVSSMGEVSFANSQTKFDAKTIKVNVPCLQTRKIAESLPEMETDESLLEEMMSSLAEDEFSNTELATWLVNALSPMVAPMAQPSRTLLNKVKAGLNTAAKDKNSAVATTSSRTTSVNSTAITLNAASPCGDAVGNDTKSIIADLAAISAQANANGFKTALQKFVSALNSISSTLTPAAQKNLKSFINDLSATIADGKITISEQATLTNDFYNLVLSVGITLNQVNMISSALVTATSTLSGISTAQLETDIQKLVTDAQACLHP